MELNDKDLRQIKDKGLATQTVQKQIETFKNEIPFVTLREPATKKKGIVSFNTSELLELSKMYDRQLQNIEVVKFVPASGAASRMFKELFRFLNSYDFTKESINSYLNYEKATAIRLFLIGFEKLPFYDLVLEATKKRHPRFDDFSEGEQLYAFVKKIGRAHV